MGSKNKNYDVSEAFNTLPAPAQSDLTHTDNESPAPIKTVEKASEKSGVFVYLGPSIRGVINNGSVFSGTKSEISERIPRCDFNPQIEKLIVPDHEIAAVKAKIKNGGNTYSKAFSIIKGDGI